MLAQDGVRKGPREEADMKAVVLTDNGQLRVEERPGPAGHSEAEHQDAARTATPGHGDASPDGAPLRPDPSWASPVLIRVAAAGVCGSDIPRAFHGKAYHYPLVLGHEFAGTVAEVPGEAQDEGGSGAGAEGRTREDAGGHGPTRGETAPDTGEGESPHGFSPGDRVAVFPLIPRPEDPMTEIGEYAVGSGYDYFGSRRDGAFQEYLWVPEANLVRVPDEVPFLHAALTEPAAVALHAVQRLAPKPGGTALVVGGGPIGTIAAQWFRIMGVERVLVSEVDPRKLEILRELDFETIDARRDDVEAAVRERTGGRGADWVLEAVGLPATFLQALNCAAVFGRVVLMGNIAGNLEVPEKVVSSILRREITILGTWNSRFTPRGHSEWDTVLRHMDRDLRIAPIISHTEPLDRGPEILTAMAERSVWFNRVVLVADPSAT